MLLPPLSIGDAGRGSARVVGSQRPSVLRPVRGSGNQALPDDTTTDGARMPTWAPADACGHAHARRACAYETYVGGYAATHDHAVHPLLVDGYASLFIHTRRRGRGSTYPPPYVDTPPRWWLAHKKRDAAHGRPRPEGHRRYATRNAYQRPRMDMSMPHMSPVSGKSPRKEGTTKQVTRDSIPGDRTSRRTLCASPTRAVQRPLRGPSPSRHRGCADDDVANPRASGNARRVTQTYVARWNYARVVIQPHTHVRTRLRTAR